MIHEELAEDKHSAGLGSPVQGAERSGRGDGLEGALSGAEGGGQVDERSPGWGYAGRDLLSRVGDIVRVGYAL